MGRVTQAAALAASLGLASSRATQATALVLGSLTGQAAPLVPEVTRAVALVLGESMSATFVTQSAALALVSAVPCVLRVAQCWRIERQDGQVFAFTSLDRDLSFRGETYRSCDSLMASAIETTAGLGEGGDLELTGLLSDDSISEDDLFAGAFDGARVEVWLVPWDPAGGVTPVRLAAGRIGQVSHGDVTFTAQVFTPGALLEQRPLTDVHTPTCRWAFGDARCGVNLASVTVTGIVQDVTILQAGDLAARRVFYDLGRIEEDGWFNLGELEWLTGANAGQRSEVKSYDLATGEVVLWQVMPHRIAIGDTYRMIAGCDKSLARCEVFNNVLNFGGFPYVPGRDKLIETPDAKG